MTLQSVTLEDKYSKPSGQVYMTGIQALVRLPMMQSERDQSVGLNTAGFISGYRGSPLGSLDGALWSAQKYLDKHHIKFTPGVNEDMAATAVWGTQQVNMYPGAKHDGVFSMWYGKGPGVDRSMDVFKHANAAGTSKYGGVLLVAGDDHASKSSTLPHQSEQMMIGASIPVLNPAGVQEILDYGMYGWALSRYSGCWVCLKSITEVMDSSQIVSVDPNRAQINIPTDFPLPDDGVHIRWPDSPQAQEARLNQYKIYSAIAFARANGLNKIVTDSKKPILGIITTGKSYLDVRQALADLGIDDQLACDIGIRVFKVGMSWPLDPVVTHEFAKGLTEVLVVEEKRSILEDQLTGQLYNWPVDERPRVIGEFDEKRNSLLPNVTELTPAMIARVIAARIAKFYTSNLIEERLAFLNKKEEALAKPRTAIERVPHFCSGCPHNSSTKVPDGSRALGGIGCHYMVNWMDRSTSTFTQMGGEGVTWVGQAPFTNEPHVFQNLGDGTYFHSGILAIRQSLSAKVNITYKILFNDAVAMTGGQPIDGTLTIDQLTHQLFGEGVRDIYVVSDAPEKFTNINIFAQGVHFYHRDQLEFVQKNLREIAGVSVIIYEQTCAAEKRRRRKRGTMVDPQKRVMINSDICEGCGDCGIQSSCLSVLPKETELGRKRTIDQDACNKDYSCVNGFCPSFVTVHGGKLKKSKPNLSKQNFAELPKPQQPNLSEPWNIVLTGVGGTGVVTTAAIVGMAAHVQGLGVCVLDMTGLAQKFGAVISHIRVAKQPEDIQAVRIPAGEANLLLGCDLVVSAGDEALAKVNDKLTYGIVNDYQSITAEFTRNADAKFPADSMKATVSEAIGEDKCQFLNATRMAKALVGSSMATNLFMIGYALQKGFIPLSVEALEKAIELNGASVEENKAALLWGRRAAYDPLAVESIIQKKNTQPTIKHKLTNLDEIIQHRHNLLTQYQNIEYANNYKNWVHKVREIEAEKCSGSTRLACAVAINLYKVMAYKDEYEVSRMMTDTRFKDEIENQFEGDYQLHFHMAPPLISSVDKTTGRPIKKEMGAWMMSAFKVLKNFKFLRGTHFDLFGYTQERKEERALVKRYMETIERMLEILSSSNMVTALELAELPQKIRGFGPIKLANLEEAKLKEQELLSQYFENPVKSFEPVSQR